LFITKRFLILAAALALLGAFAARFVMLPAAGYQTGASKKHRL